MLFKIFGGGDKMEVTKHELAWLKWLKYNSYNYKFLIFHFYDRKKAKKLVKLYQKNFLKR